MAQYSNSTNRSKLDLRPPTQDSNIAPATSFFMDTQTRPICCASNWIVQEIKTIQSINHESVTQIAVHKTMEKADPTIDFHNQLLRVSDEDENNVDGPIGKVENEGNEEISELNRN
ncbi:hypothetical protein L2E82_43346 [Cichorium intybus]|uniref:Uncharacterized protein n=1 Tax=Cichorium intybus TaxID=13427 RepID=A0ACB8ZNH3_CICIN|nr:hypothetical protein L2E82_43346 [Cichorium intybus]